jgi:hypothetical protein
MVHVKTSLPAKEAFAFPLPPLRSTANKMGRWHRRQRTPKYHCLSALGHEETFTKIPPVRSKRRGPSIPLCFSQWLQAKPVDQGFAQKWFPELLLFSTVRECEFCCGSWLFVDDQSAHGHHFLWTYDSLRKTRDPSFKRTRGPNMHEDSSWKYSTATRKTIQERIAGKRHDHNSPLRLPIATRSTSDVLLALLFPGCCSASFFVDHSPFSARSGSV